MNMLISDVNLFKQQQLPFAFFDKQLKILYEDSKPLKPQLYTFIMAISVTDNDFGSFAEVFLSWSY